MPVRSCQLCEEREADLLVSMTATGEAEWVCLVCMPFRLSEYWQAAGYPTLVFDVSDVEAEAGPAPAIPQDPPEAQGAPEATVWPDGEEPRLKAVGGQGGAAGGRKRGPRARAVPAAEPEAETGPTHD